MGDVSTPQDVAQTSVNDANDVPQILSFSNSHTGQETFGETLEGVEVDDLLLQTADVLSRSGTEESPRELRELVERLVDKVKVLAKALSRVEEARDELQTSLTVTSSNLTLALSNTEMLEEALKRAGGGGKDLGWRRWSDREGAGLLKRSSASVSFTSTATVPEHDDHFPGKRAYTNGTERETSNSRGASPTPDHPRSRAFLDITGPQRQGLASGSSAPSSAFPAPPSTSEGRFFRFRFGGGSTTSSLASNTFNILNSTSPARPSSSSGNVAARVQGSHLVSASLPSLAATVVPGLFPSGDNTSRDDVSDSQSPVSQTDQYKQRVEELEKLLASEREARDEALAEKTKIEGEVENLTAVLFEEANKMVATERKRVAEVEEELQIAQDEREALRGALKVVELENSGRKEKEERVLSSSTDGAASISFPQSIDSSAESAPASSTLRSSASSSMIPQPRSRLRSYISPSSVSTPSQGSPTRPHYSSNPPDTVFPSPNPIMPSTIPRPSRPRSLKPNEIDTSSIPVLAIPSTIPPSQDGTLQRNENGIVISRVPLSPSKAREKALSLTQGDADIDDRS